MTGREIIKKRLNHEGTKVTPYTVSFEEELYQRLTEYYKDEDWEKKRLRQFVCDYLNADTVQMREIDKTYAKDAYGALWRMDRKPWHLEKCPLDEPDFNEYDFPKESVFVESILKKKEAAIAAYSANNEQYRLINIGWGIFEHAWRIRGFEKALMDMLTDEDFYFELTENLTNNYIAMLKTCQDVPADAFMFGDDWGDQSGIIMGANLWRKFLKPCWARIYDEVHRQGKKAIHHSCGSITDIYDDLTEIGLDCHESVQPESHGMRPEVVREKWGKKICFWGCLGSQGILHSGTPAEIQAEIKRLHLLFREEGGYVLAPAKPLVAEMNIYKAVAVVETLAELNN